MNFRTWLLAVAYLLGAIQPIFASDPVAVTLSASQSYSGSISASGEQDLFRFSAQAGQVAYFDELSRDICLPELRWKCTDDAGIILFDQQFGATSSTDCGTIADPGRIVLSLGGTYLITIYGVGGATGAYQFKLWPATDG